MPGLQRAAVKRNRGVCRGDMHVVLQRRLQRVQRCVRPCERCHPLRRIVQRVPNPVERSRDVRRHKLRHDLQHRLSRVRHNVRKQHFGPHVRFHVRRGAVHSPGKWNGDMQRRDMQLHVQLRIHLNRIDLRNFCAAPRATDLDERHDVSVASAALAACRGHFWRCG